MTELQRYLAEEVAEDHADGIITRREAMRRLGLLGVTGAARRPAGVAAPSRGGARPRPRGGRAARRERHLGARRHGRDHVPRAPRHAHGRLGAGRQAPGGVLVIHENRGLTDHIRNGRRAPRRQRLLGAGARPALRGGRHRRLPREAEVGAALTQRRPSASTPT